MTEPNVEPNTEPAAIDPDELISGLAETSLLKTSLISIVFHALLIGVTSIGFISLCVQYDTLQPKLVMEQQAEQAKQAQLEAERQAARDAAKASVAPVDDQDTASTPADPDEPDREKTPIEQRLEETSDERPTRSELSLDDVLE